MLRYVGNTYEVKDLLGTRVTDGDEQTLTGKFSVEEHEPYEPSAYSYSETYLLTEDGAGPEPDEWEPRTWRVDAWELICQIDPEAAAYEMKWEMEMCEE